MTIDDAINHIKYGIIENNYPLQRDLGIEACNLAIETMRKYQKIQEIMKSKKMDALNIGLLIPKDMACVLYEIKEVMGDENDKI